MVPIRILHINTNDLDGGAARAAYRLHKGLIDQGIDSIFLSKQNSIKDKYSCTIRGKKNKVFILFNLYIERLLLGLFNLKKKNVWSFSDGIDCITSLINELDVDIVHLHWINQGFLPIQALKKINKPIIWTLHDSWVFTAGCHIPYLCEKYKKECYCCEQFSGNRFFDFSKYSFRKKFKEYKANMTIVCPSNWLGECAKQSFLLKNNDIRIISNGINIENYQPRNRAFSRGILGIENSNKVILFGAMSAVSDVNKGFEYLNKAMEIIYKNNKNERIEILVFGSNEPKEAPNFGFKTTYIGRLYDDISLNILYSVADVMVVPSKSESFGQTALEALASGTPCVAFKCTGLVDIIKHKVNGYLAHPYNPEDLAAGIEYVIKNGKEWMKLSENARRIVSNNFDIKNISEKYIKLYEEVLRKSNDK